MKVDCFSANLFYWSGPQPKLELRWHRFGKGGRLPAGYTGQCRFHVDCLPAALQKQCTDLAPPVESLLNKWESDAIDELGVTNLCLDHAQIIVADQAEDPWHLRRPMREISWGIGMQYSRITARGALLSGSLLLDIPTGGEWVLINGHSYDIIRDSSLVLATYGIVRAAMRVGTAIAAWHDGSTALHETD